MFKTAKKAREYGDRIKKMTGKIFSKDILPDESIPTSIAALLPNIDGAGRNLTAFAYDTFFAAMEAGISFIYVEFPVVKRADGELPTMADQLAPPRRLGHPLLRVTAPATDAFERLVQAGE